MPEVDPLMYYPDLSLYDYGLPVKLPNVKMVGWLEGGHDFPRKQASQDFISALRWFCLNAQTHQMRGMHECDFCDVGGVVIDGSSAKCTLGSAEIWVPDGDIIFAAPDLILHYVQEHHYAPPQAFIDAVQFHYTKKSFFEDLYESTVRRALQ